VPGRYVIPPAAIELELVSNRAVYNSDGIALDPEKVGNALVLRSWRPGDRYQRLGHSAPEKLKTLFQEYRVPSWERPEWPIITAGGFIIWVRKFGAAAQFAAGAESRTVLRIRESAC